MKHIISSLVALTLFAGPTLASAQDKPKKPSVCAVYELAATKAGGKVAICLDGKRPRVFTAFSEGTLTDPATGAVVRFLVGF